MRGSYPIECLYCVKVINSRISMSESVQEMRKHIKKDHPDKPVP